MKYKAEIFDKVQYLYEETKFNDHQLHCVIRFDGKIDEAVLKKSADMLLRTIPILSCIYVHDGGSDYWESIDPLDFWNTLIIVQKEKTFDRFTTSRIDEKTGPQIRLCLYQSEKDALSIIMNHMVCDAAGFKQCLYLLSGFYSNLKDDPDYLPDFKIDSDRSFEGVLKNVPFRSKLRSLLFRNNESNQNSSLEFPLSDDKNIFPFILTREIGPEKFAKIRTYCKNNGVTVNDVFLAAYYRTLCRELKTYGSSLHIPIMIDMRRYLEIQDLDTLSNLSSTVITSVPVSASEGFDDTVIKINQHMKKKKAEYMGINGFAKLALVFKLFDEKQSYRLAKASLKNPPICMTNVGIVDEKKLSFKGTKIESAFVCGSIKHRPHFQIALSSFADTVTISSNLYGSAQDKEAISHYLSLVEHELPIYSKT